VALPHNTAVRRFAGVWTLSIVIKLAAIVVLVALVVRFMGGT
jgi:hypothetical protein